MEDLKKRIEELEEYRRQSLVMFSRIQEALGISVTDSKGDFTIMIRSPKKGQRVGIISGILATLSHLKTAVEKISDERKIIIPKF